MKLVRKCVVGTKRGRFIGIMLAILASIGGVTSPEANAQTAGDVPDVVAQVVVLFPCSAVEEELRQFVQQGERLRLGLSEMSSYQWASSEVMVQPCDGFTVGDEDKIARNSAVQVSLIIEEVKVEDVLCSTQSREGLRMGLIKGTGQCRSIITVLRSIISTFASRAVKMELK